MDTFENQEPFGGPSEPEAPETPEADFAADAPADPTAAPVQEPEAPYTEPVQSSAPNAGSWHGTGAGYRESPYADSPYVTRPYTPPSYQQPPYRQNSWQPGNYAPVPPEAPKQPKKQKEKRSSGGFWRSCVAAVLTAALVAGGCLITAASVNRQWEEKNSRTVAELTQKIDDLQNQINAAASGSSSVSPVVVIDMMTPSQVYAENVRSVVGVASTVQSTNFYGQTTQGTSTGSGFIISENGYIVTNHHVVEGSTSVTVTTHEGEEYAAKVVGSDSTNDVAVLKVEAEGLPAVRLGSSEELAIGDMVVAIGNPLGQLTATQTVGYVSGKNREVTTDSTIINMIQTDAAINSGNSGGPLFNMNGEVVGITSAKYSGTTSSGASIEGISFAIPIDDVMSIIGDLQNFGYVTGAYLGVTVQNTDAESASLFGLPTGAYVASVVSGGAADRAGIQVKDIIIALGDIKVSNVTELTRALRHFKANDTTTITVIRSGQQVVLDITLDEKPQDLNAPAAQPDTEVPNEGDFNEWYDYFRKYFGAG